jgi:hypothetical protein
MTELGFRLSTVIDHLYLALSPITGHLTASRCRSKRCALDKMHSSRSQYMQPMSHTASAGTSTSTVPPPMTATSSTQNQQIRPTSPPRPSFYLPSPTTTTDALSRVPSRHDPLSSRFSLSLSVPGSPSSRPLGLGHSHHRSRSSLAALRSALQTYQVPDPDEVNVDSGGVYTPVHGQRRPTRRSSRSDEPVSDLDLYTYRNEDMERPYHQRRHSYQQSERGLALQSPFGSPISQEMIDALVEIHRVLYRGREDMETSDGRSRTLKWDEQGKEVKRVVERWLEGDCRESMSHRRTGKQRLMNDRIRPPPGTGVFSRVALDSFHSPTPHVYTLSSGYLAIRSCSACKGLDIRSSNEVVG